MKSLCYNITSLDITSWPEPAKTSHQWGSLVALLSSVINLIIQSFEATNTFKKNGNTPD